MRIELVSGAAGFASLLESGRELRESVFLQESFGETSVGECVTLVERERALENLNGTADVLLAVVILEVAHALEAIVVGTSNLGAMRFVLGGGSQMRVHAEHFEGGGDDGIFDAEGVILVESKTVGAKLATSAGFDEDEVDASLTAGGV